MWRDGIGARTRGRYERERSRHYVYQIWSGDQCLYVGMTFAVGARMGDHGRAIWWGQVTHYSVEVVPDRDTARFREAELIRTLNPRINVYGKRAAEGDVRGA